MNMKKILFVIGALAMTMAFTSCRDKKEQNKAEYKIEKAKEDIKDAADKVSKDVKQGAEKAKKEIKEGYNEVKKEASKKLD